MLADRVRMTLGKSRKLIDRTTPTIVVNQPYSTKGNGGRKLVRLDNGWIIAGVLSDNKKIVYLYVDKLNGDGFKQLCFLYNGATYNDIALEARGNIVYIIISLGSTHLAFKNINATLVSNTNMYTGVIFLDQGQTTMGNCSMIFDKKQKILHVCWASKNENYPNSFNIRYRRGRIDDEENSISWSNVEQVTDSDWESIHYINPSIAVSYGVEPMIAAERLYSATPGILILSRRAGEWIINKNFNNERDNPSKFPTTCVANDGTVYISWCRYDGQYYRLTFSKSLGNYLSWSDPVSIFIVSDYTQPSIVVNSKGEIFIQFHLSLNSYMYKSIDKGETWKGSTVILRAEYPSLLDDNTLDFEEPLGIYMTLSTNTNYTNSVVFRGKWYE